MITMYRILETFIYGNKMESEGESEIVSVMGLCVPLYIYIELLCLFSTNKSMRYDEKLFAIK